MRLRKIIILTFFGAWWASLTWCFADSIPTPQMTQRPRGCFFHFKNLASEGSKARRKVQREADELVNDGIGGVWEMEQIARLQSDLNKANESLDLVEEDARDLNRVSQAIAAVEQAERGLLNALWRDLKGAPKNISESLLYLVRRGHLADRRHMPKIGILEKLGNATGRTFEAQWDWLFKKFVMNRKINFVLYGDWAARQIRAKRRWRILKWGRDTKYLNFFGLLTNLYTDIPHDYTKAQYKLWRILKWSIDRGHITQDQAVEIARQLRKDGVVRLVQGVRVFQPQTWERFFEALHMRGGNLRSKIFDSADFPSLETCAKVVDFLGSEKLLDDMSPLRNEILRKRRHLKTASEDDDFNVEVVQKLRFEYHTIQSGAFDRDLRSSNLYVAVVGKNNGYFDYQKALVDLGISGLESNHKKELFYQLQNLNLTPQEWKYVLGKLEKGGEEGAIDFSRFSSDEQKREAFRLLAEYIDMAKELPLRDKYQALNDMHKVLNSDPVDNVWIERFFVGRERNRQYGEKTRADSFKAHERRIRETLVLEREKIDQGEGSVAEVAVDLAKSRLKGMGLDLKRIKEHHRGEFLEILNLSSQELKNLSYHKASRQCGDVCDDAEIKREGETIYKKLNGFLEEYYSRGMLSKRGVLDKFAHMEAEREYSKRVQSLAEEIKDDLNKIGQAQNQGQVDTIIRSRAGQLASREAAHKQELARVLKNKCRANVPNKFNAQASINFKLSTIGMLALAQTIGFGYAQKDEITAQKKEVERLKRKLSHVAEAVGKNSNDYKYTLQELQRSHDRLKEIDWSSLTKLNLSFDIVAAALIGIITTHITKGAGDPRFIKAVKTWLAGAGIGTMVYSAPVVPYDPAKKEWLEFQTIWTSIVGLDWRAAEKRLDLYLREDRWHFKRIELANYIREHKIVERYADRFEAMDLDEVKRKLNLEVLSGDNTSRRELTRQWDYRQNKAKPPRPDKGLDQLEWVRLNIYIEALAEIIEAEHNGQWFEDPGFDHNRNKFYRWYDLIHAPATVITYRLMLSSICPNYGRGFVRKYMQAGFIYSIFAMTNMHYMYRKRDEAIGQQSVQ